MVKKLDLSSEQKAALKTIRSEQKEMMKSNMREMRKGMREGNGPMQMQGDLSTFMTADHFDKNAFKTQMDQI